MPLLVEPVPLPQRRLLREAVLALATSEHRHHFPPTLHVGTPGGPVLTIHDERDWDHGLRTDVVGAALRSLRDPAYVWVTRVGDLGLLQDPEAAWMGPVTAAADERGADPCFVVVTRHGWRDPRSGAERRWRRIRRR